jgi:chemotaxis response regulator CheB
MFPSATVPCTLSPPQARHCARLLFAFLLHSLAEEYGDRAIGVILLGTGADGSLGLRAIQESHGFVIAQDPEEAAYDGMRTKRDRNRRGGPRASRRGDSGRPRRT